MNEIEQLELELEFELASLGIKLKKEASKKSAKDEAIKTIPHSETPEAEQKTLGTLKNGVVLLSKVGVTDKGYIVYEAVCPFCHKHFVDSRDRMSKRDHCGCQSHIRRAKAQAKGVATRLAKNSDARPKTNAKSNDIPAPRKPYNPDYIPFEKAMDQDEKVRWGDYLQKTLHPGGLALYVTMPQSHREVLASLLAYDHGKGFEVLEFLLKDSFIEMLDLCQAQTIAFPTRGEISRRIAFIRLFERWKNGQTPEEIAYTLCDDPWRIVELLRRLQAELRDFQRRNSYDLSEWWGGERFLNIEIAEDTKFQSVAT